MNDLQKCAGINVTTSRLQLVEIVNEGKQLGITNIGQKFITPPINFEVQSDTEILSKLQIAYKELINTNSSNGNNVSFTLPPELFITIQLPFDSNLNQKEIKDELMWEISQLYPFIEPEKLAVKFYELDSRFLSGKNNVLVVLLDKKYLFMIKSFCKQNNLVPKLVDSASIAANSFTKNNLALSKESVIFNIFNSKDSVSLFINVYTKPAYLKVFQKKHGDYISSIINELESENLTRTFNLNDTVRIISGDEWESELVFELQRATGFEFIRFNPFDIIKIKPGVKMSDLGDESLNSFISAAGIGSRFN